MLRRIFKNNIKDHLLMSVNKSWPSLLYSAKRRESNVKSTLVSDVLLLTRSQTNQNGFKNERNPLLRFEDSTVFSNSMYRNLTNILLLKIFE